ncbi:MAG: hypothetical protein ACRESE_05685 [Gammaproteobacteria bacterium]
MNTSALTPQHTQCQPLGTSVQRQIGEMINDLIASLPDLKLLTSEERRGIIARYTSVLEANFIYWMSAALLSIRSEDSRRIILDNLHDEVRDAHPAMLRRFAIAAHAFPTDSDALAVNDDLTNVRLFFGRLSGVQTVLTMAFFEGFIKRFMTYLADLARAQGSIEREYTDVHGICDIVHTEEIFRAFELEMALNPMDSETGLFEGVYLLRGLIQNIIHYRMAEKLSA